ncbi:hypothetical protein SFRURICE_005086 [Spodoptera frugiperda]|nr:hypothetical protein SFRURICE_005086 [Spodoptera frugiperda]
MYLLQNRYAMLRYCRCAWLPPIIFIGTLSLALVETESAKLCFQMENACYGYVCDGFIELRIFLAQLLRLVSVRTVT